MTGLVDIHMSVSSGRVRSYQHKCTGSHQNSEVKRVWARVVLRWVSSWDVLVLHPPLYTKCFAPCDVDPSNDIKSCIFPTL